MGKPSPIPVNRSTVVSYFKEPKAAKAGRRQRTAPSGAVVAACPACDDLGAVDPRCPVCKGEGVIKGVHAQ